jgi:hypothetical protein
MVRAGLSAALAIPKSASTTRRSGPSRMLAGFTSRCSTPTGEPRDGRRRTHRAGRTNTASRAVHHVKLVTRLADHLAAARSTRHGGIDMAPAVADYLLERQRAWDVRHVFAYAGDGINGILAAWGRADNEPQFVQARHEQGGGAGWSGADTDLAEAFVEPVGADRLAGASAGQQPWGGALVSSLSRVRRCGSVPGAGPRRTARRSWRRRRVGHRACGWSPGPGR